MASLGDSLRLKMAGAKAPAVFGSAPLSTPDSPLGGGKSGGISASKSKKNAGSTPVNTGYAPQNNSSKFMKSVGGTHQSDKTVGYF